MSAPAYALVTGASRGIGRAFAEGLAAQGHPLILTARNTADLETLRQRLQRPGVDVQVIAADLLDGPAALLSELLARGLTVDLLVNNAGFGSAGSFAELPLERELGEVKLNIAALVALTHAVLPGMRTRRAGAIVNVASTAAFQPVPWLATYAATKAFVLHFSLALREELRGSGVHVMALCPGPTDTSFFAAAGIQPLRATMDTPEEVVQQGLRGLARRRAVVVCGARNRALIAGERLLPRAAVPRVVARLMRSWRRVNP